MNSLCHFKIDLDAPLFVKVISVTENRFVLVPGVNGANDEFLVLGVITGFDVRLWIDIQVRRPIHESNRKQVWFFGEKPNFCPENPIVGLKPAEYRHFRPFRYAKLSLQFIRISNSFVLNLQADRQIARALKIGRNDLAQAFGGGEGGARRKHQDSSKRSRQGSEASIF